MDITYLYSVNDSELKVPIVRQGSFFSFSFSFYQRRTKIAVPCCEIERLVVVAYICKPKESLTCDRSFVVDLEVFVCLFCRSIMMFFLQQSLSYSEVKPKIKKMNSKLTLSMLQKNPQKKNLQKKQQQKTSQTHATYQW